MSYKDLIELAKATTENPYETTLILDNKLLPGTSDSERAPVRFLAWLYERHTRIHSSDRYFSWFIDSYEFFRKSELKYTVSLIEKHIAKVLNSDLARECVSKYLVFKNSEGYSVLRMKFGFVSWKIN